MALRIQENFAFFRLYLLHQPYHYTFEFIREYLYSFITTHMDIDQNNPAACATKNQDYAHYVLIRKNLDAEIWSQSDQTEIEELKTREHL